MDSEDEILSDSDSFEDLTDIIESERTYTALTPGDVVERMDSCIREITTTTDIPAHTVRILLKYFKWNEDRLMENLYDGDQNELFKKVGVVNPFRVSPGIKKKTIENEINDCEICFMGVSSSMMTGLKCGHQFCKDCWIEYLTFKIMTEGVAETISCASHNCNIIVDYATIMKVVTDSKVKVKYQRLILNNYVEFNKDLTWCTNPKCTYIIKSEGSRSNNVKCLCKHNFCFSCKENGHEFITCTQLKKWLKKHTDNLGSYAWINDNTKDCPKCGTPIEKDGGCNHMICKKKSCQYEFCWNCLKAIVELHRCAPATNKHVNKNRQNLQNYASCYKSFIAHKKSLEFEINLRESIKTQKGLNVYDILPRAVDILCNCRQTLMQSYIFSCYVINNSHTDFFRNLQLYLENATEKLSHLLEKKHKYRTDTYAEELRTATDYCETRLKTLMHHVSEGYDKNWWTFDEEL